MDRAEKQRTEEKTRGACKSHADRRSCWFSFRLYKAVVDILVEALIAEPHQIREVQRTRGERAAECAMRGTTHTSHSYTAGTHRAPCCASHHDLPTTDTPWIGVFQIRPPPPYRAPPMPLPFYTTTPTPERRGVQKTGRVRAGTHVHAAAADLHGQLTDRLGPGLRTELATSQ